MYSSFSQVNNVSAFKFPQTNIPRIDYGVYSISSSTPNSISFPTNTPTLISAVTDPITIEFFIKNNSDRSYLNPGKYLFGIGNSAGLKLEIRYANQGTNRFHMYDPNANGIFRYSTTGINYNQGTVNSPAWHHIAFVYKTSDMSNNIYIDGQRMTNNAGFTETNRSYVNQTTNQLNTALINSGLNMYILSSNNSTVGNNMDSAVNTPIYNLRITKTDVYTNNFTVPSQLDISQSGYSAGSNIKNFTDSSCVFCLESYRENGIVVIRDKVQNSSLTSVLALDTATGART